MDKDTSNTNDSQIKRLAYQFWEERGRPPGSPDEDWFRAKMMFLRQSQSLSSLLNGARLPFSLAQNGLLTEQKAKVFKSGGNQ